MTNNGTKSRREYVKKCQDLGFGGDHKDIFTTSYLCAKYLQNQGFNKKVYLFGNKVCSYNPHLITVFCQMGVNKAKQCDHNVGLRAFLA